MSYWITSAVAVVAALAACSLTDLRRAVLALWIAGLGVGGVYLALGAELLAVVQWSVSTLVAISFIFYGAHFGELGVGDERPARLRLVAAFLPFLAGGALAAVVSLSAGRLLGWSFGDLASAASAAQEQSLALMGRRLVTDHLPALQILAFLLFTVVVGAGVLSRPETRDAEPESGEERA